MNLTQSEYNIIILKDLLPMQRIQLRDLPTNEDSQLADCMGMLRVQSCRIIDLRGESQKKGRRELI